MKRNLIITADDYGMCEAVNHAIEECLIAGAVRSTCVMVNMQAFDPARHLRKNFPQVSIGIHWTLTEGTSVLPPSQIQSLVGEDDRFHNSSKLRRQWLKGRISVTELKAELRAQYQRFFELLGPPDFWNTHQNIHVFPGLFEVCLSTARELQMLINALSSPLYCPMEQHLIPAQFGSTLSIG